MSVGKEGPSLETEAEKDITLKKLVSFAESNKFVSLLTQMYSWGWETFKTNNDIGKKGWVERYQPFMEEITDIFHFDFSNSGRILEQFNNFLSKYPFFRCDTFAGVIYLICFMYETHKELFTTMIESDVKHKIFNPLPKKEVAPKDSDDEEPKLKPLLRGTKHTKPEEKAPPPEPKSEPKSKPQAKAQTKPKKGQKTITTKTTETTITEDTN